MWRLSAFALASLAVAGACAPQSAGPAATAAPSASPEATSRPANRSSDQLLVRTSGTESKLVLLNARDGQVLREWRDGTLFRDDQAMYVVDGPTGSTTVSEIDLANGKQLRSTTLEGTYRGPGRLSPNGRWLTLVNPEICTASFGAAPAPSPQPCVSRYAILDTAFGAPPIRVELPGNFWIEAISNDGRSLYVRENLPPQQPIEQHIRVYDLERKTLLAGDIPVSGGPTPSASYWNASEVFSPDGKRRYTLAPHPGDVSAPMVNILELDGRVSRRIDLPAWSFNNGEEVVAWTLLLTPDGRTLYAVNGLLGAIVEIDTDAGAVRRAEKLNVKASVDVPADEGIVAAVLRWFFPIAEAKRSIRGGARLSPDGETIYALGDRAIHAVTTRSLTLTKRLATSASGWGRVGDVQLDGLALSPDGARIYALSDDARKIFIFDAASGASLGDLEAPRFAAIVRVLQP